MSSERTRQTTMSLREIDAAVWRTIFGHEAGCAHDAVEPVRGSLVRCVACGEQFGTTTLCIARAAATPPPYSTDIAAAWQVVAKMGDAWHVQIENSGHSWADGGWTVTFAARGPFAPLVATEEVAMGKSAPLTICLAALRAVGIDAAPAAPEADAANP